MTTNRRRFIMVGVALLILAIACAVLYFRGRRYEVIITQSQIDEALRTRFPVTKKHLLIFQITYSNPKVRLLPAANRIEVGLDAELTITIRDTQKKLTGSAIMTTGLKFKDETDQFFLAEPELQKLTISGIPEEYLGKVLPFASVFGREQLEKYPVYTLKSKNLKTTTTRLLLRDLKVMDTELHATLGL